jgi:insulysin
MTRHDAENHRAVILAMFKYLTLLRSSSFPAWYQSEIAKISATRFRFQEKGSPDTLAVRITEHMSWPLPPELIISGPQVVREWDCEDGEKQVREILEGLTVKRGRAVLMARGEEHEKVSKGEWMKEKWYGTEYRVVQFDEQFIHEASCRLFLSWRKPADGVEVGGRSE